jgi:hypothetical protein
MCQWAATELSSAQCEERAKGYEAHKYQDRKLWLCEDAKKISDEWRPCSNISGKHGRNQVDIGSTRNIPCPVCRTVRDAESEYNRAMDEALARYNAAAGMAEARKDRKIEGSTMFTTYVSRTFPKTSRNWLIWNDRSINAPAFDDSGTLSRVGRTGTWTTRKIATSLTSRYTLKLPRTFIAYIGRGGIWA